MGYQELPSLGLYGDNKFVVIWQSRGQDDGREYGIFGKYFYNEPINHALKDFDIFSPSNDQTLNQADPTFFWNQATNIHKNFPWELTYDIYIDKDDKFINPIIIPSLYDTTYQIDTLASGQAYFWKVLARNYYSDSLWSSNVNGFYIDQNATEVELIRSEISNEFELFPNYPNPFNPSTNIKYQIPKEEKGEKQNVKLVVYNILGREIKTLVNEIKNPGFYEVEFDADNLPSGIYFYRLQIGENSQTKKMVLLR